MPEVSPMENDAPSVNRQPEASDQLGQDRTFRLLLWGLAALTLGQALQNGDGFLTAPALGWLTFALVFAALGVISQRRPSPPVHRNVLWAVLVGGLALQLLELLASQPASELLAGAQQELWQFRAIIGVGGVCALLSLAPQGWHQTWVRRVLIGGTFFAILAAGVWIIRASPKPFIDVYLFQQSSSGALLRGQNPYELTPPNIYGDLRYYGPEWVNKGNLTIGNPYPPFSIYLSLLGYVIAGDIRYSCLAAILITGLLMIFLQPGREALLAAYIYLFTPRLFFVLGLSWTEPLVVLLTVAVVWCAIHRPSWRFVALGLLVASKQYMIFLFPMGALLIPGKASVRNWAAALGQSIGVAAAVTAPLAFWNFPAFVWNVGLAQVYQPFRMDALSYIVLYAHLTGDKPTQLLAFIALGAAMWLAWRYGEPSPAGFAAALALGLGLFFAFNKQAFCNYYFLVLGLLCCALAATSRPDRLFTTSPERG